MTTAKALVLIAFAFAGSACGDDESTMSTRSSTTSTMPSNATPSSDEATITDFRFEPESIEVDAGTEVTWTNEDDFAHTVTARDGSFDSMDMGPDASFSQSFDEPGEYEFFCNIHNYMTGTVVVR